MPDVVILPGGAPVKNTILVTVDEETMFGDGSPENPLRSESAGEGSVLHVSSAELAISLDGVTTKTFVTYTGEVGPEPVAVVVADGEFDGVSKRIVLEQRDGVTWVIQGSGIPTEETTGSGSAVIVWDAQGGGGQWYYVGLITNGD